MMTPLTALLVMLAGYLIGSFSIARLITRLVAPGTDLSKTDFTVDGVDAKITIDVASATTVSSHLGPRYGFMVMLGDMAKIAVPVIGARVLWPGENYFLLAAISGMMGHIWPIYHRFKGGRGFSAVYGSMLGIDPIGVLVTSIAGMFAGLFVLRDVFVAYLGGIWLIIPWLWLRTHDLAFVAYGVIANLIILVGLIPEIRQYLACKRQGVIPDPEQTMQISAMGRGLYRMGRRFSVFPKKDGAGSDPGPGTAVR